MKAVLLCGYRDVDPEEIALGVKSRGRTTLIDHRITQLQGLGFEVICVLGGTQADEQLRHCPLIPDCELVFDTNEPLSLLSNTRSGAFAAPNEALLVLPLEVEPPPREVWDFLLNEYGKAGFGTPAAVLQLIDFQGAPYHHGFPMLLTRTGRAVLQTTPDLTGLLDTRLDYLRLAYPTPLAPLEIEDLAQAPIPL